MEDERDGLYCCGSKEMGWRRRKSEMRLRDCTWVFGLGKEGNNAEIVV